MVVAAGDGVGSGDGAQRGEQNGHTLAAVHRLSVAVLVVSLAGHGQQPGGVFGPFGVSPDPEQIGKHTRRADLRGGPGGQHRRQPDGLGRGRFGGEGGGGDLSRDPGRRAHPDVFGGNGVEPIGRGAGGQQVSQAADHRGVAAALGDGEQPHSDARGGHAQRQVVRRGGGELRELLAHPLPGGRLDACGERLALRRRQVRSDDRLATGDGLDQQARQIGQQVRALEVGTAPVHRRGRQQWRLAEEPLGELGQEAQHTGAFQHAAAQRVDHGHRAPAQHFHQAHDTEPGVGAQIQRIGVVGVDASQHHVDALQCAHRAHPQLSVADHQISALHQRQTQQAGEIGLVESGFGVDAGAEDHDDGLFGRLGRRLDQRQAQRLRPRGGGPGTDLLVEVGDGVRDHPPVGQGVAGAGRGLRPVGVDQEVAG